jgi:hypothetical protein
VKAIIRFYKMSFLIGAHVFAVGWGFFAIKLFSEGKTGPAITAVVLSGVMTMVLAVWWLNCLPE